jgi:hypothetical protein
VNRTLTWIWWVVVACVAIAALVFAIGGTQWLTAPFRGAVDQRERTVADGGYRIASYDRFYNLCASIQAKEQSIANLQAEPSISPERSAQVVSSITALRNSRADLITTYNGDARKAGTAGQFRASDLPFQIDTSQETTTCSA